MSRLIIAFSLLLSFCTVNAQQNHFIYIQTENKQPFSVKLDNQVFSSTATGYLIVPKLKNGVYNLQIGFVKSDIPDQTIVCTVENKDAGYLLKNFGAKGWGLFNLQTSVVTMSGEPVKQKVVEESAADDFSGKLSKVVNDPGIRQPEPKKPVSNENAVAVKKTETIDHEQAVVSPAEAQHVSNKFITKTINKVTDNGTELQYLIREEEKTDTVNLVIPKELSKKDRKKNKNETVVSEVPVKSDNTPIETPQEVKIKPEVEQKVVKQEDPKGQAVLEPTPEQKTEAVVQPETKPQATSNKTQIVNSNCKGISTDEDFLKLRKKMAGSSSDEDMINIAKKAFKLKCFSTDQIKNLSVLFLKDSGKYAFFDAAYPFVTDSANYGSLESQLTESYYITRFKVMLIHY